MPVQTRTAGTWKQPSAGVAFAHGAWRTLVAGKEFANGAWRTFANFTAPPAPPPSGGGTSGGGTSGGGGGTITVTISPNPCGQTSLKTPVVQSLTATPSGGLAPYTYQWAVVSTTSTSVTFNQPNSATTSVSVAVPAQDTCSATLKCTVTDSLGTTASAQVSGDFANDNTGTL